MTRTDQELHRRANRDRLARTLGEEIDRHEPIEIRATAKRTPEQHQREVDELAAALLKQWPICSEKLM